MMYELRLENENSQTVNVNDGIKYEVLSVSGLNPPKATVFSAKSPNKKGSKKNGSTLDERIVIIQIKLLGDVEASRNDFYAWSDTEQELKIYYRNGKKNIYCEGTVTDCDIDLFTSNETVNIAIFCNDPYLYDMQNIVSDISSILKQFTFPFAIDSLGIPFSTVKETNTTNIFNAGAETGVKITVKCNGEVSNLRIYNAIDTTQQFKINRTLQKGWIVEIDTEGSPKTVKLIKPDGTTENLLKDTRNPTWFTLKKGNNLFGYSADSGVSDAEITIGFRNKYLGV